MTNAGAEAWILTLVCKDGVGIVAAVSRFLAERGGFITDSQQYADRQADLFFMRVAFEATDARMADTGTLRAAFTDIASEFAMDWSISHPVRNFCFSNARLFGISCHVTISPRGSGWIRETSMWRLMA